MNGLCLSWLTQKNLYHFSVLIGCFHRDHLNIKVLGWKNAIPPLCPKNFLDFWNLNRGRWWTRSTEFIAIGLTTVDCFTGVLEEEHTSLWRVQPWWGEEAPRNPKKWREERGCDSWNYCAHYEKSGGGFWQNEGCDHWKYYTRAMKFLISSDNLPKGNWV